jgi:dTDP-4-dehydrorhamnose 3,5-epimerase
MSQQLAAPVPEGVRLGPLQSNVDGRGCFTEIYRRQWQTGIDPVQWNVVQSNGNVLRGVHLHRRHADYLCVVGGEMFLGLHDARPDSASSGLSAILTLSADAISTIYIPIGVAHGFYFPQPSIHVYAVSEYWDPADELGCHWRSPELGFEWPCTEPLLSQRDQSLGDYASMIAAFR